MTKRSYMYPLGITVLMVMAWFGSSSYLASIDTTPSGYLTGLIAAAIPPPNDSLIRVNLYSRTISLYEGGSLLKQSMISGSGNPNNSTATPTGSFRILSKELRHISGLSGVIMPYSLRFFGGYYFHAIPSTPNGVLITTRYSAGCIRLPDGFVEEVYDWARIGTRVEIYRAWLARSVDSPTVYLLTEDGRRQPIVSEYAFIAHGFKWSDVAVVPASELAAMPVGGSIQ